MSDLEVRAVLPESLYLRDGRSVLHLLAGVGHDEGLEKLIVAGASTELRDGKGFTPLHVAVALGHEKAVQTLLGHGADVHAKSPERLITPLHALARYGTGSSASSLLRALLLHAGDASDLIAGDIDGDTPFHWAAAKGDAHLFKEMLEVYNNTMLPAAPPASSTSISFLDQLRNKKDQTPLHVAAFMNGHVSLLLQAGASKYVRDAIGATPFHVASARCRNTSVLDLLQLENVNDVVTSTQHTALHFAAWFACIDAVKWLLEHGALVDSVDEDGFTPLHLAAINGSPQVIEILILEGGANAQKPTSNKGELALGLADENEHHHAAKALVKAIKLMAEKGRFKDSLWEAHNTNGATLLHYFAAYGTEEDLKYILQLMIQSEDVFFNLVSNVNPVNKRDNRGRTAVHWAAMRSNKDVVSVLAENKADLNAESKDERYKTPLSLAVINGEMEFAEKLLKWKPKTSKADDWLEGMRTWMSDYYSDEDKNLAGKELASLKNGFEKHTNVTIHNDKPLFSEIPPLYLALHAKRHDIAMFIQRHSKGVEDAVNAKGESTGRTALHWATLLRQREIVAQLCREEVFARELTANVEDKYGKTALQYAKQLKLEDIEKELMLRSDVKSHIDGMYKDRQVYVDAANAILVGAALIAGVTFAGWLQPPLGYTAYNNLPQLPPPSPPDIFQTYAEVQQHMGVRLFWVFNSLSFSFAIATMIAGLVAVVPIPGTYIATSVAHVRRCLPIASAFLGLSIVFVLAAFAAAGFAVLPPIFEYQANMMATVIVGGIPCLILLAWFATRLWSLRPECVRAIETQILSKLHRSGTLPGESESKEDNPQTSSQEGNSQQIKMDSFSKLSVRLE